jgi:two-component system response regulator NreC
MRLSVSGFARSWRTSQAWTLRLKPPTASELWNWLDERATVAVLDVSMPNLNGLESARRISSKVGDVQRVMLTLHVDQCYLLSAVRVGARRYVLKNSADFEIVQTDRAVVEGKASLSPRVSRIWADDYIQFRQSTHIEDECDLLTGREREILQLLAEGKGNRDITDLLNLSSTTVICDRQYIFQKRNLHSLAWN